MATRRTRAFILRIANDYPWRIDIYYYLLGQNWYGHIDKSNPRPEEKGEVQTEWDREDAKAMAFTNSVMAPTFKLQFKAATTLKALWDQCLVLPEPRPRAL